MMKTMQSSQDDDVKDYNLDNIQVFKVSISTAEPMALDQLFYIHSNAGLKVIALFEHYANQYFARFAYISFELTNYDSFNIYYETVLLGDDKDRKGLATPDEIAEHLTDQMERFISPLFISNSSTTPAVAIRSQEVQAITMPSQCYFVPNTGDKEKDKLLLEEFITDKNAHDRNEGAGDSSEALPLRAYLCGDAACFKCNSLAPCSRDRDCMFLSSCTKSTNVCSMMTLKNDASSIQPKITQFFVAIQTVVMRMVSFLGELINDGTHKGMYAMYSRIVTNLPTFANNATEMLWTMWLDGGYLVCLFLTIFIYYAYFGDIPTATA